MWEIWRRWTAFLIIGCVIAAPSPEDVISGNSLEEASSGVAGAVGDAVSETVSSAADAAAAAGSDGLFDPQLRVILGALENVDDMLRTTLPSIDKFQCVERVLCSMMAAGNAPPTSSGSPLTSAIGQVFNPTFQQGVIQNPQLVQQDILQNPSFQQGLQQLLSQSSGALSQNPAAVQQALQGIISENPEALQEGIQHFLTRNPGLLQQGLQQVFSQFSAPQQQGFQTTNPAFQQGFAHPPPPPGFHSQFHAPQQTFQQFQGGFQQFRENPDHQNANQAQTPVRRTSNPRPLRRGRPTKRTQRNGFLDFLSNLGLGKRKKRSEQRSLFDSILSGFSGGSLMGIVDRMMTGYSFYPYTHAAFMGYSGASKSCETLYPKCPSTPEEMIDVFNNIHRHYPDGFPYKEQMPWLLRMVLP